MAYLNSIFEISLPENKLSNNEISSSFPEWSPDKIYNKIGIEIRHHCALNEDSLDLANNALIELAKKNENLIEEIDFLIYVSNSSRKKAPGDGHLLLNLNKSLFKLNPGCLDLNLGCSGYSYALGIASALIQNGSNKKIMIVTSDNYSKYISKKDKNNITLFGDAATISIVSNQNITNDFWKISSFKSGTFPEGYNDLFISNTYNSRGSKLNMNGQKIFKFSSQIVFDFIKSQEIDLNQYVSVFHQANSFMLLYLRDKLKIDKGNFITSLKNTGNTVSSSIPISIKENLKVLKNKDLFLCGFGIGASYSSVILKK